VEEEKARENHHEFGRWMESNQSKQIKANKPKRNKKHKPTIAKIQNKTIQYNKTYALTS